MLTRWQNLIQTFMIELFNKITNVNNLQLSRITNEVFSGLGRFVSSKEIFCMHAHNRIIRNLHFPRGGRKGKT